MGKQTTPIETEKKVVYVGKDEGYLKDLANRFKTQYHYLPDIKLIPYMEYNAGNFEKIYVDLVDLKPSIIYLDFSSSPKEFLEVANFMKRDYRFKTVPIVGLLENATLIQKTLLGRVDFVHIKGGEIHDVVFDPMYFRFKKVINPAEFAKASFRSDGNLILPMIIGYITPTSIHVETNIPWEVDEVVYIETAIPQNIVPSRYYTVIKKATTDLIYDYAYSYDLRFHVLDRQELTEEEKESPQVEKIKVARAKEYEDLLERAKRKLKEWVQDGLIFSKPKLTKVLLFDERLELFRRTTDSSRGFAFSLKVQTSIDGVLSEIDRTKPQIIVFNFSVEPVKTENKDEAKDPKTGKPVPATPEKKQEKDNITDLEKLTMIVKKVQQIEHYAPYVISFNNKDYGSKDFQDTFKYSMIMANPNPLRYELLHELSQMFEKKTQKRLDEAIKKKVIELRTSDPKKYRLLRESDLKETKYYIDKQKELALAFFKIPVKLFEMTESEFSFFCPQKFDVPLRCLFDFPIKMNVTLVPTDIRKPDGAKQSDFLYHGLVHGINELAKQEIRKFVNKIFFADLEEVRKKEKEDYELKKNEMLKKKLNLPPDPTSKQDQASSQSQETAQDSQEIFEKKKT